MTYPKGMDEHSKSQKVMLLTGAGGDIGQAFLKKFQDADYFAITTDKPGKKINTSGNLHFELDLESNVTSSFGFRDLIESLPNWIIESGIDVVINNAADQIIGSFQDLSYQEWHRSINVNFLAPVFLIKDCWDLLVKSKGLVLNIGSVHDLLSKPSFAAYATSKSALASLSRTISLEAGGLFRINTISPGAVETKMLVSGFEHFPEKLDELISFIPSKKLGSPSEIALLGLLLAENNLEYLSGAEIRMDGGISNRLHDPL
jgi:NAD(P)-dependent dehydrogenase (short-subunit alcohol dehydrogenase family)